MLSVAFESIVSLRLELAEPVILSAEMIQAVADSGLGLKITVEQDHPDRRVIRVYRHAPRADLSGSAFVLSPPHLWDGGNG